MSEYRDVESGETHSSGGSTVLKVVGGLVLAGAFVGSLAYGVSQSEEELSATEQFILNSNIDGVMEHLMAFNKTAQNWDMENPARSVATGYNDSAIYVEEELNALDFYDVRREYLFVPVEVVNSDPILYQNFTDGTSVEYQIGRAFTGARYGHSPATLIGKSVVQIPNWGCTVEDYAGLTDLDVIALVKTSSTAASETREVDECGQFEKGLAAMNAGVSGAILYRPQDAQTMSPPAGRIRKTGWLQEDPIVDIPVIGGTWALAQNLINNPDSTVGMITDGEITREWTYNVIAESRAGNPDQTLLAGAHLDSVPEGPGLNDNGSGSAMLVELAKQFALTNPNPKNRITFAWWAAEEIGLLGSYHFVDRAEKAGTLSQIKASLNFDMMASPNGRPSIHFGTTGAPPGSSDELKRDSDSLGLIFVEQYDAMDKPYQRSGMTGGSDFLPFMLKNIPTSGLATGAGGRKSVTERDTYGGFVNAPHDPCYHQFCDAVENIGQDLLESNTKAAARVIGTLANRDNFF